MSPARDHHPAATPLGGASRAPRQSRYKSWPRALCVLFIAAWLGGCSIIEAEKHNRGGYLDEIADDLWMKADSKKMRALRAITLEASLARIAMIAPKNASDRSLLARRIGETTKRADMVRRCAFGELQLAGQLSSEPCFFFDSVMVDYENALFDLALVALPIEEARNLIGRVSAGVASVSLNPLQLVQALIDIGREAFRYGRVVGAIYRDTLELEVQVWLASSGADERLADLARIYARGNDDILAWRAAIAALRGQGLEPIPQQRFILQLYGVIAYICGQIVTPNPADPAYNECARPDLRATLPAVNLPVATGPGGNLFPRSGGTSQRPGEVTPKGARDKAGSRDSRESPTKAFFPLLFASFNKNVYTPPIVDFILSRLCVPPGTEDAKAIKPLIKVFQQTMLQGTDRAAQVTGLLTQPEVLQLNTAPTCPLDRARNFYEARELVNGVNSPDMIGLLNKALPNGRKLAANATVADVRSRIPEIRRSLVASLQLRDPELADQLTPDLVTVLVSLR